MPKKEDIRAPSDDRVIQEISIDKIDTFPDHPYKVLDDGDMEQLAESIRAKGLITPLLVRKMYHGRFELVSGHRRLFACRKLGMDKVTCEVRDMSKEEAIITMVESNFQRDRLLPSEKAFAYKMRLEAMKFHITRMRENQKQGRKFAGKPVEPQIENASEHLSRAYGLSREDIAKIGSHESRRKERGAPVVHQDNRARMLLAKESPDSHEQIRRYIRLTELIPELLTLVDEKKIAMRPAVEMKRSSAAA